MRFMQTQLAVGILTFIQWFPSYASLAAEFMPESCEYSVSFPEIPNKYTQKKATADGELVPLYGAQLVVAGGTGQIRAECGSAAGFDLNQVNNSNITVYMQEIAKDLGLSRSSYETKSNALGYIGTVTGVKDTERGRITVRVINIIGDSSILTLYLMALSKDFQTPEMNPFFQSVKKR